MENSNNVPEFILLGFIRSLDFQNILFVSFLITYVVTVVGNVLIVVAITSSQTLCSPMYIFLAFLSLINACYSKSIVHKMLTDFL